MEPLEYAKLAAAAFNGDIEPFEAYVRTAEHSDFARLAIARHSFLLHQKGIHGPLQSLTARMNAGEFDDNHPTEPLLYKGQAVAIDKGIVTLITIGGVLFPPQEWPQPPQPHYRYSPPPGPKASPARSPNQAKKSLNR